MSTRANPCDPSHLGDAQATYRAALAELLALHQRRERLDLAIELAEIRARQASAWLGRVSASARRERDEPL